MDSLCKCEKVEINLAYITKQYNLYKKYNESKLALNYLHSKYYECRQDFKCSLGDKNHVIIMKFNKTLNELSIHQDGKPINLDIK